MASTASTTRRFLIATDCTRCYKGIGQGQVKSTTGKEEEEEQSAAVGIRERDHVAVKRVGNIWLLCC